MIIFVGGLIGAGKSTIARRIAGEFGCHYYDADDTKRRFFEADPDFERNMAEGIPFSDATRVKVFEQVIADLEMMRERHDHVVVDETLHRRDLRQRLYQAAERLYGSFLIVWVRADDEVILERLSSTVRKGHVLDDPVAMYQGFRKTFQEFNRPVIVVNNNGDADEEIAQLRVLLESVAGLVGRQA
ncbi:AAA family ATPase [Alisedimentitalea sp. MJ-SS2]|uniref:AAA family ATPase n=1 Tax=Aliisedimentitalea sp. MJ-SS2 TaxID=3049795 RepID=UPI00290FF9D5|nr:AAA family ATPase [Alisedimentitalea sp. MJ-SS2]MDU8926102.1 AAA family ATPase [Alisedimentitalea sp. MJ-SS2]